MLLPGVDVKTMNSGKVKSGLGKDALAQGAYDAIATVVVPSGGQASIVFAGIPQGYRHLQLRGVVRTTAATTDGNTNLRFNDDSSSSYNGHYLFSSGGLSVGGGGAATAIDTIRITGANTTANIFGAGVVDILDYSSSTKTKVTRTVGSNEYNITNSIFIKFSGLWTKTEPIKKITLTLSSGNFAEFSQIALYGVK
jgi:hypothetical protein